jgi:ABC-type hemin transport system substrate-binding protein
MGTITVQGALIMADGYDTIDCTPDESPRFLQCIKALKMGIPLLGERRTVDQLLNQLDDIADRVESRSKAQALSIRECTKRLREAVKE